MELRSRRIAGKMQLKNMSTSNQNIFKIFRSIKSAWNYVPKTLPILALVASSFIPFSSAIYRTNQRFQLYDTPYSAIIFTPDVLISPNFLRHNPKELSRIPHILIDTMFNDFIQSNFPTSLLVFTDGSISPRSAGYLFYFPSLNIYFADKLDAFSSSFTEEYYAIICALQFSISLDHNNILFASDSQSCLLAFSSNPFNSSLSPLVLLIKSLVFRLYTDNKCVQFV
jgi:hypothetical protein